jgi:acyl-CoA thioesterase II
MTGLHEATLASLDDLLRALDVEPTGGDHFQVRGERGRFARVFGGQLLAQALVAAGSTVADKAPQSLHAYFVQGGEPGVSVDLAVERVRDGRSMSSRRVSVIQSDRTLLTMLASFHDNPVTPDVAEAAPPVPPPEELPLLQDWVLDDANRVWVDQPPPIEVRIGEAPSFMGGPVTTGGSRSHWMRLPRELDAAPLLHAALLAYASDYLLLDMAFRSHPQGPAVNGTSVDHTVWFHRPVRFDRWHLHTQETIAVVGERGLVRGAIHDADGHLVASVMQEVLVRAAP